MPSYNMGLHPGLSVRLAYTAGNGRITGLEVDNTTGGDAYVEAVLTDGLVIGRTFGQGATSSPFPLGVRLEFDAQGEPTFTGLASVRTRIPA